MRNFVQNLKKYYFLLLNTFVPYLIFLFPVYTSYFIDEIDKTIVKYNFYNLMDFENNALFSILMIFFFIFTFINLILFILSMINYYKIKLYKPVIDKMALLNNILLIVLSVVFLVFTIIYSCKSGVTGFRYKNMFSYGSVMLVCFELISLLFLSKKQKEK